MPRADRSIPILTGLIIAALYVILLVGFSRESYMRRDASARANSVGHSLVVEDAAKRTCRVERTASAALSPDIGERRSCITPLDGAGRIVSEPVVPLTLERLRRAMRDNP
jgi:hypothetical protein